MLPVALADELLRLCAIGVKLAESVFSSDDRLKLVRPPGVTPRASHELEIDLIQTQMAQTLHWVEKWVRVRCAWSPASSRHYESGL